MAETTITIEGLAAALGYEPEDLRLMLNNAKKQRINNDVNDLITRVTEFTEKQLTTRREKVAPMLSEISMMENTRSTIISELQDAQRILDEGGEVEIPEWDTLRARIVPPAATPTPAPAPAPTPAPAPAPAPTPAPTTPETPKK